MVLLKEVNLRRHRHGILLLMLLQAVICRVPFFLGYSLSIHVCCSNWNVLKLGERLRDEMIKWYFSQRGRSGWEATPMTWYVFLNFLFLRALGNSSLINYNKSFNLYIIYLIIEKKMLLFHVKVHDRCRFLERVNYHI